MNMQKLSLCTDEQPFPDHLLSTTFDPQLCFLGNLNNENAKVSPVSLTNSLFKTIFKGKLSY